MQIKTKTPLLLLIFSLSTLNTTAQGVGSSYQQQQRSLLIYNIAPIAIISGIGAAIKSDKKPWGKEFLKGFVLGGIGGFCMYQGKNMITNVYRNENLAANWPAKFVFYTGESLAENAISGQGALSRFHFGALLTRIDFDFKKNIKVRAGIDVYQTLSFAWQFTQKHKLDLRSSIKSGVFIFRNDNILKSGGNYAAGLAIPGSIIVSDEAINNWPISLRQKYAHSIYAHELVHTYQFNYFSFLLGLLRDDEHLMNSGFTLHLDPSPMLQSGLYRLEGRYGTDQYYRNFFEFEAEFFAKGQKVIIN